MIRIYNVIYRTARPAASLLNLKLLGVWSITLASHRRQNVLSARRERRTIHGGVAAASREFELTKRAAARFAVRKIPSETMTWLQTAEARPDEVQLLLQLAPFFEIFVHFAIITPNVIVLVVGESISARSGALGTLLLRLSADELLLAARTSERTVSAAAAASSAATSAASTPVAAGVLLLVELYVQRPVTHAGDARILQDHIALAIKLQGRHVDGIHIQPGGADFLPASFPDGWLEGRFGGLIHRPYHLLLLIIRSPAPTAASSAAGGAGGCVDGAGAAANGAYGAAARSTCGGRRR